MQGQHIFARCRNEQGNAGSWTAAITEDILDKKVIKNDIEPHCNINESFARYAMLHHPQNSILRIYHLEDATIISRTFWENDTITEENGRKGAYTVSFILTGDEEIEFNNDCSGAFDANNFEPYALFSERCRSSARKVEVDTSFSILRSNCELSSIETFKKAGIDESAFLEIMGCIYSALEENKKVAIILPQRARDAWRENGDNISEEILYSVLMMFPTFTRANIGVASNWSCALNTDMLRDIHIVFVNPEPQESYTELKQSGAYIVDLDKGTFFRNSSSSEYLSFVWKNKGDLSKVKEFWNYAKQNYRKLLKYMPNSLKAIEAVYLIYVCVGNKFTNKTLTHKAFLACSEIFAGAGSKVPTAEDFIFNAIKLSVTASPKLSKEDEEAIATLVDLDKEPTSHQKLEYDFLFQACNDGTASSETVEILQDELFKDNRGAMPYFIKYLEDAEEIDADRITPQMVTLVAGILQKISKKKGALSSSLMETVAGTLFAWGCKVDETEKIIPILKAYKQYLGRDFRNNSDDIIENAYAFVISQLNSKDVEVAEYAYKILTEEEKKIYSGKNRELYSTLSTVISKQFPLGAWVKAGREYIYQCFFRLIFFQIDSPKELDVAYRAEFVAVSSNNNSTISIRFSDAMDRAFDDMKALVSEKDIVDSMLRMEKINLEASADYIPTKSHVSQLFSCAGRLSEDGLAVANAVAERIKNESYQNYLFDAISRNPYFLEDFYTYAVFHSSDSSIKYTLTTYVGKEHPDRLKIILASEVIRKEWIDDEDCRLNFVQWYESDFANYLNYRTENEIRESFAYARAFLNVYSQEYDVMGTAKPDKKALTDLCKSVIGKRYYTFIDNLPDEYLTQLSIKEINSLLLHVFAGELDEGFRQKVQFIKEIDNVVDQNRGDSNPFEHIFKRINSTSILDREAFARRRLNYLASNWNHEDVYDKGRIVAVAMYCEYLHTKGGKTFNFSRIPEYEKKSNSERIVFIFKQLNRIPKSSDLKEFKATVENCCTKELERIASQEPSAFNTQEVMQYAKGNGNYYQWMKKRGLVKEKLDFDFQDFLKVVVLAIAITVASLGIMILLFAFAQSFLILMFICGAVFLVASIVIVAVAMLA